jgi:hypothetical protein
MKHGLFFLLVLFCFGAVRAQAEPDSCRITTLPYVEDFSSCPGNTMGDDSSFVPCWERLCSSGGAPSMLQFLTTRSYAGVDRVMLSIGTTLLPDNYSCVVLPMLDSGLFADAPLQLRVRISHSVPTDDIPFYVVGMADSIISMMNSATIDPSIVDTMGMQSLRYTAEPYDVIFPLIDSVARRQRVALLFNNLGNLRVFIEKVTIEHVPVCGTVHSLRCSSIGSNRAMLNWDYSQGTVPATVSYSARLYPYFSGHQLPPNTSIIQSLSTTGPMLSLSELTANSMYCLAVSVSCPFTADSAAQWEILPLATPQLTDSCPLPTVFRTDVTDSSLTIEWFPNINNMTWDISYRFYESGRYGMEVSLAVDYPDSVYTLGGLLPGNQYKFVIRPSCNRERLVETEFSTTCPDTIPLPYFENFENYGLNCWSIPGATGASGLLLHDMNVSNHFVYMQWWNMVICPPIVDHPVSELMVKGYLLCRSVGSLALGVVYNNDYTSFVPIDTVTISTPGAWEPFVAYLDGYSDTGGRLALRSIDDDLSFDNLTIDVIPSCRQPEAVEATVTSTRTATLRWHDPNNANSYQIEYGPHGFTLGEGTQLSVVVDTATLAGLHHSTRYDVYVRTSCMGEYSEWSLPISFVTSCGDIDYLPYMEDFDSWEGANVSGTHFIPCWRTDSYYYPPNIWYYTDEQGLSNNCLRLSSSFGGGSNAILPRMNRSRIDVHGTKVSVDAWHEGEPRPGRYKMIVGVKGSTLNFFPVDTLTLSNVPQRYEVYFDSYPDTGEYITFLVPDNTVLIDNVVVDYIPNCRSARGLRASHVDSTHAQLSWNPRSVGTQWQIVYGPCGFDPDNPSASEGHTGTMIVTGSTCTLNGLHPATEYDVYIRTLCPRGFPLPGTDTSQWSVAPLLVTTTQTPARLPYYCNFEDSTEAFRWQTYSNRVFQWHYGADTGDNGFCYQFKTVNGGLGYYSSSTINAVVYRDIDFSSMPSTATGYINSPSIAFSYKNSSLTNIRNYRFKVLLVDPALPPLYTNYIGDNPWSVYPNRVSREIASLTPHSEWTTDTINLDTLRGTYRLVFFVSIETMGDYTDIPMSIDNVEVFPTQCPRPFDMNTTAINDSSADLTWYGDPVQDYQVTVIQYAENSYFIDTIVVDTVHTNHIHIGMLDALTTYYAQVRRICREGDLSNPSDLFSFTTPLCNEMRSDTVENGPTTDDNKSNDLPITRYQPYSYTQQIFPASAFAGPGSIQAINIRYCSQATPNSHGNTRIYLCHTVSNSFHNSNDFIDPSLMQLVYIGPMPSRNGWNKIVLQTPFEYDGSSNVVLAVLNNVNSTKPNGYYVNTYDEPVSIILHGNSEIEPSSLQALWDYVGTRKLSSSRNHIIFDFCPGSQCPSPKLKKPNLRYSRVTLRWHGTTANNYEVNYRLNTPTDDWTSLLTSDTSITINDIYPNYLYIFRVRSICNDYILPQWSYGTFRTSLYDCAFPENLHITSMDFNQVSFAWTPDENNSRYGLHLHNSTLDSTLFCYADRITIEGLERGVTYYATVKAFCSPDDHDGDWSDPLPFTTPTCPNSTNLTYSDLQGNSVVLDWDSPDSVSLWEIQYGSIGFDQGYGISVITDTHPYTIRGLIGESGYDAYVRSICDSDLVSEQWSNVVTFTTPYSDITPTPEEKPFSVSPNPARSSVSVSLANPADPGCSLSLRDASGHEVRTLPLPAGSSHTTLSVKNLPAGPYFITLTTPDNSSTLKLILQ